MLWILTSLFFFWCAYHEIRTSIVPPPGFDSPLPVSKPYLAIVLALGALFAWPPVHTWYFEWFLSAKATELADNHRARVHCNTVWDTMLNAEMLAAAHANPRTAEIGIQHPWCGTLMSYLHHPQRASEKELWSLGISRTRACTYGASSTKRKPNVKPCSETTVRRSSSVFRMTSQKEMRSTTTTSSTRSAAESAACKANILRSDAPPGKPLDEHLPDSTWAPR